MKVERLKSVGSAKETNKPKRWYKSKIIIPGIFLIVVLSIITVDLLHSQPKRKFPLSQYDTVDTINANGTLTKVNGCAAVINNNQVKFLDKQPSAAQYGDTLNVAGVMAQGTILGRLVGNCDANARIVVQEIWNVSPGNKAANAQVIQTPQTGRTVVPYTPPAPVGPFVQPRPSPWAPDPFLTKTSDQKLLTCNSADCSKMTLDYYTSNVTVPSGPYAGSKVMLLDCGCGHELGDWGDSFFRFIHTKTGNVLLQKYSTNLPTFLEDTNGTFTRGSLTVDNQTDIPALDPYQRISDPKNGAVLELTQNSKMYADNFFFNNDDRKPVFIDGYGEAVYAAELPTDAASSQVAPQNESFEIESVDGAKFSYYLDDPFLSTQEPGYIPSSGIRWNSGEIHGNGFIFDPAGSYDGVCQLGNEYIKAVASYPVSKNDLVTVGTNISGQPILSFSNSDNPITRAAQTREDLYEERNGSAIKDPVIYWQDPFGRLVRFVSVNITAGCD